jgi:hypothetical protein
LAWLPPSCSGYIPLKPSCWTDALATRPGRGLDALVSRVHHERAGGYERHFRFPDSAARAAISRASPRKLEFRRFLLGRSALRRIRDRFPLFPGLQAVSIGGAYPRQILATEIKPERRVLRIHHFEEGLRPREPLRGRRSTCANSQGPVKAGGPIRVIPSLVTMSFLAAIQCLTAAETMTLSASPESTATLHRYLCRKPSSNCFQVSPPSRL